MKKIDLYNSAHLVVSAIRILDHQSNMPPSIDNVCTMLAFSREHCSLICKKLKDMEIIDIVEGAFGSKLCIRDFTRIETIPSTAEDSTLRDELKKYQEASKEKQSRIESIKAQQDKKKKDLFAALDKQLKSSLDRK